MRIRFDGEAGITAIKMHYDEDTDARTLTPSLEFLVTRDDCVQVFGEDFTELVFASLVEGSALCSSLKPAGVCEQHVVSFAGGEVVVTSPKVTRAEPSSRGGMVRVTVTVPVDFSAPTASLLAGCYGQGVRVKLEPAQLELPGVVGVPRALVQAVKNMAAMGVSGEVER